MLPLPLLNLLAPRLDAWTAGLPAPRFLEARHNRWHVAAWAAVIVGLSFALPFKRRPNRIGMVPEAPAARTRPPPRDGR